MRPRSLVIPTVAVVVIAAVALLTRHQAPAQSAHAAPGATHSGHVTIPISNYAFLPKSLTVTAGTRVTWVNHDATAHTATANGGAFDTGTINPHASRTIDLTHPGTYAYHCVFHAFMTATITVRPR